MGMENAPYGAVLVPYRRGESDPAIGQPGTPGRHSDRETIQGGLGECK